MFKFEFYVIKFDTLKHQIEQKVIENGNRIRKSKRIYHSS